MATKQINPDLTPEQANVCFFKGTERPFANKYYNKKDPGAYLCINCGQELFSSDTKYDSGTGWPAFYDAVKKGALKTEPDGDWGMRWMEVLCSNCDIHLGHVFEDGPKPTGLRYCINSAALDFRPAK